MRAGVLTVLGVAIGVGLVQTAAHLPARRTVAAVVVDVRVGQTTIVEFFWNDFVDKPRQVRVTGGERATVEFAALGVPLRRLRIDPTNIQGDVIELHGIVLRLTDGSRVEIPLDQVAGTWQVINATPPVIQDGALRLQALSGDPMLFGDIDAPRASRADTMAWRVRQYVRSTVFLVQAIVLGAAIASVISLGLWGAVRVLATVAVSLGMFVGSARLLMEVLPPDQFDVARAVGFAAFHGFSVSSAQWATVLAGAVAIGLASLAAFVGGQSSTAASRPEHRSPFGKRHWLLVAGWTCFVALFLLPDFAELAASTLGRQHTPTWDDNNFVTWEGLVVRGDRPFSDFWWPYSGLWLFYLPLPYGATAHYLYQTVLFSLLGCSLLRIFGDRQGTALAVALVVLVLGTARIIGFPERYLLSVVVALAYVGIDRGASSLSGGRAIFWGACLLAIWGEPLQFAYAAPAIALVLIVDEGARLPLAWRGMFGRAVQDFGVPAGGLVAIITVLAVRNTLSAVIETYAQLAASATYAALPTNVVDLYLDAPGILSMGSLFPFVLLSIGTFHLVRSGYTTRRRSALAILACGLVGMMVAQKVLIRPLAQDQLLSAPVTGALLLLADLAQRRRLSAAIAIGVVGGALTLNPPITSLGRSAAERLVPRLAGVVPALTHVDAMAAASRGGFSPERFKAYKDEMAAVDALPINSATRLFVLGDMPIFYLFSRPPAPFQINLYNASPIQAQLDLASSLRREPPDVVILDRQSTSFDTIQHVVRLPILTTAIILDYTPEQRIGRYEILKRRPARQPILLDFWSRVYGDWIDFGRLLDQAESSKRPECSKAFAPGACLRYLAVTFAEDVPVERRVVLQVMAGPWPFRIAFLRTPGRLEYLIPVDRVWFWRGAETNGLMPEVTVRPPDAARVQPVSRWTSNPVLY